MQACLENLQIFEIDTAELLSFKISSAAMNKLSKNLRELTIEDV